MTSTEIATEVARLTGLPLPKRCCGLCSRWTRLAPDDLTAPEGKCGLKKEPVFWPLGYWPNTLQRDGCSKFSEIDDE